MLLGSTISMEAVGVVGLTCVGVPEQPRSLKQRPPTHLQMLSKIAGREKTGWTAAQAPRDPCGAAQHKQNRYGLENFLKTTPLPPLQRPPGLRRG